MFFFRLVFLISVLVVALSVSAQTFQLSVVTEDAYTLQSLSKTTGEMEGPAADLVERVINDAGIDFTTKVLPWARAYKEAEHTANTLIYSIVRTPERESKFHWLGVISEPQYYLFAMKDSQFTQAINTSSFKSHSIGTILNSASYLALKAEDYKYLVPLTNAEQVFGMLTKNRVDFITANKRTFQSICINYSVECEKIIAIAPIKMQKSSLLYFAINKESDPRLVTLLRESYIKLLSEGEIVIF